MFRSTSHPKAIAIEQPDPSYNLLLISLSALPANIDPSLLGPKEDAFTTDIGAAVMKQVFPGTT